MNILLYGGGIDSTVLAYHLKENGIDFSLLHIDYGQKAYTREALAASRLSTELELTYMTKSIDLSFSSSNIMKSTPNTMSIGSNVLELRNMVFISYVASYIASFGGGNIYLGYHVEPENTSFLDATSDFVSSMNVAINSGTKNSVYIEVPFYLMERQDIYDLAHKYPNALNIAYTCYENKPCGICSHCVQLEKMENTYKSNNL